MQCTTGREAYTLCGRVGEDPARRAAFEFLARPVFDLDSAPRYAMGYWGKNDLPHALYLGDKAVSCVAVKRMPVRLSEEARSSIRLGTVMNHPPWRGRGLARYLMEYVLKRVPSNPLYLFANDSAVGVY